MIPANLSLIPLSHERRAAMQAIAEVEKKYERGVHIAEFAYAHAFFRILNGSKRVTVKDIGWFSPGLTAQNLRGKKQDWLAAIDRLIESRGACCWLPLSVTDGWRLFPETKFQTFPSSHRTAGALCLVQCAGGDISDDGFLAIRYLVSFVVFYLSHDADGADMGWAGALHAGD